MKLPIKLLLGFLSFFFFLLLILLFKPSVLAQVPPGKKPCDSTANPEFHSLRPYQANPCDEEIHDTALFCGNDLVVVQSIKRNKNEAESCHIEGDKEICEFKNEEGGGPIAIDLSGATLPIAGNTELVPNSKSATDSLSFADRVNEYANWYLQGAAYKAENGSQDRSNNPLGNPFSKESEDLIVNYSGPIRKLLPQSKTFEEQSKTVGEAKKTQHNQIVACKGGLLDLGFSISWERLINNPIVDIFAVYFAPEWLQGALNWHIFPKLFTSTTKPCYAGNNSQATGERRLTDWQGIFLGREIIDSVLNILASTAATVVEFVTGLNLDDFENQFRKDFTDAWGDRLPPIEGDPRFNGSRLSYLKAYNEWRGRRCAAIDVPLIDTVLGQELKFLFCTIDPTASDDIANLFSYVPLSSNEDRKGAVEIDKYRVYPNSADLTIHDVKLEHQLPAELFFPHMQAISEHAEILQSLFTPSGVEKTGPSLPSSTEPYCDILNVRSNPGDNLFAGEISADLSYLADFTCEFSLPGEGSGQACPDSPPYGCPDGEICSKSTNKCILPPQNPSCTKKVAVNLSTITKTPLIEDIWQRLIEGPASVFKRIFPKVGPGGAIEGVLDIPASTKVTYKYTGNSTDTFVVAGNPALGRTGDAAEIYFPHLGSVQEYFLKGIQTILRPKGFGEQIISGQSGTLPTPPPAGEVDCNQNAPDVTLKGVISKEEFGKKADLHISTSNFADECYNDVVAKARARGVNPAYALVTWLLESGASNYTRSVEDFGVHKSSVRGFNAQIQGFINTVTSGIINTASGQPQWNGDTLLGYLFYYNTGEYDPNDPEYQALEARGRGYADAFKTMWTTIVATGCPLPTGPTDNSCP